MGGGATSASARGSDDTPKALITPRGVTTIAPSVVEKLASRAAGEVDGVEGEVQASGPGRLLPWTSASEAVKASADVRQDRVRLSLDLKLGYPRPLKRTTEAVRTHVIERITQWTGLQVDRVDISVTSLGEKPVPQPRVV